MRMSMWTKEFWRAVAERAIKTFAQTIATVLTAAGVGLLAADWVGVFSAAGMALLLSVLTSVGSAALTDGSPSLVSAEVLADGTEVEAYEPERMEEITDNE